MCFHKPRENIQNYLEWLKFPFFWVNNGLDFFLFIVLFLDLVLNPNQKLIWIETRSHTHTQWNKQTNKNCSYYHNNNNNNNNIDSIKTKWGKKIFIWFDDEEALFSLCVCVCGWTKQFESHRHHLYISIDRICLLVCSCVCFSYSNSMKWNLKWKKTVFFLISKF